MKNELEAIRHGCCKVVRECLVARYGEWFYSGGDSVNVLHNSPRSVWSMIEFISDHDERGQYSHPSC